MMIIGLEELLDFEYQYNVSCMDKKTRAMHYFKKIFPFFILWFILASVITTLCHSFLPEALVVHADKIFGLLKTLSKFFIVLAMAAIGLNTNIVKLVKTGGKPLFMGGCCWIAITFVSLLMQHILKIW